MFVIPEAFRTFLASLNLLMSFDVSIIKLKVFTVVKVSYEVIKAIKC
jgi:hypothetical protein